MADNKELKPVSYRIDDETKEKVKQIADDLQLNQQGTIQKLIEAFELQKSKSTVTDAGKKEIIDTFDFYTSKLNQSFISVVQGLQDADEKAETKVADKLLSKDATIQDLQEKLTVAKQLKEDATVKAKTFADENVHLNGTIENLTKEYTGKLADMQEALKDKTDLVDTLKDSSMELKYKVDSMQKEHEQFLVMSSELDGLKHKQEQIERDKATLQRENDDLQKQLDRDRKESEKVLADQKKHEADALERLRELSQLDMDKAILALEKKHQDQIEKLKGQIELIKEQKQSEVDKYQQRYLELLEQIKNQAINAEVVVD
jgi:chromosome segregation ATPase